MGANPCAGSSAARGQEREVNWVGAGSEERSRMETKKKKMEENPKRTVTPIKCPSPNTNTG